MAFCPNCGNEINDDALFCGNCGNKTQNEAKLNSSFKIGANLDFKRLINAMKDYFLNFYVDYNSKIFKFAMILFMAVGIGQPLYATVSIFLPENTFNLLPGASAVLKFLICFLLFAVFCVFILIS